MSKELYDVRIMQGVPGFAGTLVDFRFVDKSKGFKDTEIGPMLKYGKFASVQYEYDTVDDSMLLDIGNRITEMLCDEQ